MLDAVMLTNLHVYPEDDESLQIKIVSDVARRTLEMQLTLGIVWSCRNTLLCYQRSIRKEFKGTHLETPDRVWEGTDIRIVGH